MAYVDARLMEMQFLARLEREDKMTVEVPESGGPTLGSHERQMIISLLRAKYVNGLDSAPGLDDWMKSHSSFPDTAHANIVYPQLRSLVLGTAPVDLRISHKGRVRLSKLRQQLKTGRDRDPTGLCVAKRHLTTDLTVDVISASTETPLSVVFLDMNGLKDINDKHGHHAGDEAIHAYLEAVVMNFGEHGEAYRGEGGDEVVVILPGINDERAGKLLDGLVRQLGKEVLVLGDAKAEVKLTASCGSASTSNPNADADALLKRADAAQYRAKEESRKPSPRVSAIAVGDGEVKTYAPGA